MLKSLPVLAAVLALLAGGLAHGWYSGRWHRSDALANAPGRLEQLPIVIGDWRGQTLEDLDPREVAIARIVGHTTRLYVNERTQQKVRLLIACGYPGPISLHTPDVCFQGAGYTPLGSPVHYPDSGPTESGSRFWTTRFGVEGQGQSASMRVCWAWSVDGQWHASTNPRWEFRGQPVLYKLYLIQDVQSRDDNGEDDACLTFIPQLLPVLEKTLFHESPAHHQLAVPPLKG